MRNLSIYLLVLLHCFEVVYMVDFLKQYQILKNFHLHLKLLEIQFSTQRHLHRLYHFLYHLFSLVIQLDCFFVFVVLFYLFYHQKGFLEVHIFSQEQLKLNHYLIHQIQNLLHTLEVFYFAQVLFCVQPLKLI